MSTFVRNTRSSSNLGLQNNNKPTLLNNKPIIQNGLNKNQSLANKQPLKRNALSSTTNLLSNNLNAGKIVDNEKKQFKQGTSENAFTNEFKATAKGLGGLNKASSQSRIPIKSGLKLKQQQLNQQKQFNKQQQQIKKSIKIEEENVLKFSSFKIPDNVENIDQYDSNNVLLASDFSNDIYIYLRHLENEFKLKSNFLQTQQQMTSKMRARLIDWIIAVHHKFKLLSETLYLTIAIMDRFLEKVDVTKEKVQLVGLTAFFIACKYEEIYPPEIEDFIKVCDAYSKNDILKMEKTILLALDFKLSYPLPLHFLRRFSKAAHADQEIHTFAKYIMELGLVEYECSSWKPSLLAAASLYITLQILSNDSKWTETLAFYTEYTEDELHPYVITLCKILTMTKESKLQTVNKKYSSLKLLNISNSPKLTCDYVLEMSEKYF